MLTTRRREQLKLALALERRLPAPPHSAIWPPDHYWRRFCLAAFRTNRVHQSGWRTALARSLEELEHSGKILIQQVRVVSDLAQAQLGPRTRSSLREILLDIEALENEFDDVAWNLREKTLSVVTEPVMLQGIPLGRFRINLEYQNLSRTRPYGVIALDPNPAAGEDTTTHPHVRDEELCEGDGGTAIRMALRQGRFYDLFVLINQILHTYNKDSAYVPLCRWDGTTCPTCGSTISDDDTVSCEECHADACVECSSSCSKCCSCLCAGCQDRCGTCGDTFCRSCLMSCPGCSASHCASCLKEGRCADCPPEEQEETQADEEIPTEAVPAEPEVQSLCLGQAPVPEGSGTD